MQITPKEIAGRLASQAESVARMLLPAGKMKGDEWCVGSVSGEEGESLKINTRGDRAGLWKDFSSGDRGGDLLDLWSQVHGVTLSQAIKDACEYLGIERPKYANTRQVQYKKPERPEDSKKLSDAKPVSDWLLSRGITATTAAQYQVFSKGSSVVVFPYSKDGEVVHLKFRDIKEKKFYSSKDTMKCLFGWQALNPMQRWAIITEGEMDALAFAQYGFPALSLPYGGGKAGKQDWIETEFDALERFDTIYLSMDDDETGRAAAEEISDRLGRYRCKLIKLPKKDANECLMSGIGKDIIVDAMKKAKTLDPRELRNVVDFRDDVVQLFYPPTKEMRGFYLPWASMVNEFHFGWGETSMFAGFNGHGKSQIVGQLSLDATAQNVRCCVASLEFKPGKWIARLVRQAACKPDPRIEEIDNSLKWMTDNLWVFDVWGTAKIDRIIEVFSYARQRYGVKLFVIDNFSKLGIPEDDLNEQKRAISLITEFAVSHDVHVFVVAHMRKEDTEMQQSGKLGVRGSGTLTDLVDNLFIVWRNKPKEHALADHKKLEAMQEEEQRKIRNAPDTILRCEKYRNGDAEPRIPLWFDRNSTQFSDQLNGRPRYYLMEKQK